LPPFAVTLSMTLIYVEFASREQVYRPAPAIRFFPGIPLRYASG
jgi:hypothetical protein